MDAAGSVLEISRNGEHWRADVLNVTGFSAPGDRRIVMGLGENTAPVKARIQGTDGSEQDLGGFDSGRYHIIRKDGRLVPVSATGGGNIH